MSRSPDILRAAAPIAICVGILFGLGCIFVFSIMEPLAQLGAKPTLVAQESGAIVSFFEQDRDNRLSEGQTSFCHVGTFTQTPGFYAGIGELIKIGWSINLVGVDFGSNTTDWVFCWMPEGAPASARGTDLEGQLL